MSLNDFLIIKIAKMYYEENKTQEEISKEVFISRSQVSRALKKGIEKGIIQIKIKHPLEHTIDTELEFIKRFKIIDVHIAQTYNDDFEESNLKTFRLAANYINSIAKNKITIGITWGKTLRGVVNELDIKKPLKDIQIIQLTGNIHVNNTIYSGPEIAKDFAYKFKSKYMQTTAPLYVDNITVKKALIKNIHLKRMLDIGETCNIAIFSVGNLISWSEVLDKKIYNELIRKKSVGHIMGYFFNKKGEIINTKLHDNIIAVDKSLLFNRRTHKILIAVGVDKAEAILGALKSNLVTTLITDYHTAKKILDLDHEEKYLF